MTVTNQIGMINKENTYNFIYENGNVCIYMYINRNSRVESTVTKMNSLEWLTADLSWQKKESVTLKIYQ